MQFSDAELRSSKILIIDDQASNVRLIGVILDAAGFHNHEQVTDPRQSISAYRAYQPDLLLLDLHMPHCDGFTVMSQLATYIPAHSFLPILVLTADVCTETRERALAAGANDFLLKPFDATEAVLRIRNLLHTRRLHLELQRHNELLEGRVQERTRQLEEAHLEILNRLAMAAEYRDDDTGEHTERVSTLAAMIARELGHSEADIELLRLAAKLHDVGKIGVPDCVLMKPGILNSQEFAIMKAHANIGGEILGGSKYPILRTAREIALSHHEHWNGKGYPLGLKGEEIPLSGRIVAVADVFDALTHVRPYKRAWSLEEAVAEMKRVSGTQFDPELIQVFLSLIENRGLANLAHALERTPRSLPSAIHAGASLEAIHASLEGEFPRPGA